MVGAILDLFSLGIFHRDKLGKRLVACRLDTLGDHVHRLVQGDLFPVGATRSAIQGLGATQRIDCQLETRRPLRAEGAAIDWAVGVAFDVNDLAVLHTHEHAAAHRAVGTDTGDLLDARGLEALRARLGCAYVHQRHDAAYSKTTRRNFEETAPTEGGRGNHSVTSLFCGEPTTTRAESARENHAQKPFYTSADLHFSRLQIFWQGFLK